MFKPRLLEIFQPKGYSPQIFLKDLSAGVVVGIVAIPLAVAFAIASGVTPNVGLVTAVVAGFLISALGGSHVQIGGPTGAFIVIVYGIVTKFGVDGLVLATLMAGVMLLALGFGRLGSLIQFIPFPVLVGFTSGIAVIIFSSQINDFLGLELTKVPADFLEKWALYLENIHKTNFWALGMAVGTILVIVILQKVNKRLPAALIALVGATLLTTFLPGLFRMETIGQRFGEISGAFPLPQWPAFSLEKIQALLLPAFSIAMLAGIESLLSAVVADSQTGKKHDSNQELIGQGFANLASALFGGIPATGAIARTATNIRSGGQTPVAGLIHAVFLLGVLLFLSPLTGLIPLAALAGILATVAYNMSEHHTFRMLLKGPRGDLAVLLVTFILTVLIDLTIAIPMGILLALLAFLRSMSQSSLVRIHQQKYQEAAEETDPFGLTAVPIPEGVEVLELEGPLFFGAAQRIKEELAGSHSKPPVRILGLRDVPSVDSSGIQTLRELVQTSKAEGTRILFSGVAPKVKSAFDRIGFTKELGEESFLPTVMVALHKARRLLGHEETTLSAKVAAGLVIEGVIAQDGVEMIEKTAFRLPVREELKPSLMKSLLQREQIAPTGLGHGLAFPHPRNPLLTPTDPESISFVYLEDPIEYGAEDGKPVHTGVFILSHTVQSHLKALSQVAKLARDPEFLGLLEKRQPQAVLLEWLSSKGL